MCYKGEVERTDAPMLREKYTSYRSVPVTTNHQTFRKSVEEYSLVSIYKKAFVVGNNMSPEIEKQLMSTFKRGLSSMGMQIQIIRQNLVRLAEDTRIAMLETSIQSSVMSENNQQGDGSRSPKAEDQAINRYRD